MSDRKDQQLNNDDLREVKSLIGDARGEDFSLDDMARYLHGILEHEEIEHPVLIGQSLGGYLSQCYVTLLYAYL